MVEEARMNKANTAKFLAARARKHLGLAESVARQTFGNKLVLLDYPVNSRQRWGHSNPHRELYDILNRNRASYIELLKSFLAFTENLVKIPVRQASASCSSEPSWINGWMPALDGVALYCLME
jgi:hypothetical protein